MIETFPKSERGRSRTQSLFVSTAYLMATARSGAVAIPSSRDDGETMLSGNKVRCTLKPT